MSERLNWEGWFSLELPNGWEHTDQADAITVYDPEGVGAFTISAGRRDHREPPKASDATDLSLNFARSQRWNLERIWLEPRVLASSPASLMTYRETDGDYWQVCHVIDEKRVVTISYVCASSDEKVEAGERDDVLSSFAWDDHYTA